MWNKIVILQLFLVYFRILFQIFVVFWGILKNIDIMGGTSKLLVFLGVGKNIGIFGGTQELSQIQTQCPCSQFQSVQCPNFKTANVHCSIHRSRASRSLSLRLYPNTGPGVRCPNFKIACVQ